MPYSEPSFRGSSITGGVEPASGSAQEDTIVSSILSTIVGVGDGVPDGDTVGVGDGVVVGDATLTASLT